MLYMLHVLLVVTPSLSSTAGEVNLSSNKPARQSSEYNHDQQYSANKAVNGKTDDFSHTAPVKQVNWWTVDLGSKYSIGSITLYNRAGFEYKLEKVSILTSNSTQPSNPSLSPGDWTRVYYRESAYPAGSTTHYFDSPIEGQHVAILNTHIDGLALAEVEIRGEVNLAYNKSARQSSEYTTGKEQYPASNAVNGKTDDFSHTAAGQQVNWWTVDLGSKYSIGSITLYNRAGYEERLEKVSILTSNSTQPSDPSLSSDDWTRVHYRESAYPATPTTHNFDPPIEGQHVAILNTHKYGLALAEVVIREYSYSKGKDCSQQPDMAAHPASNAVDGNLSTYSSTQMDTDGWWRVDLGRQILLREVKVFVQEASRLNEVYFLTTPNSNQGMYPNKDNKGGWRICSYKETPLENGYTRSCDTGLANPLTRQFSIFSTADTILELREVEVHGYELPQLSADIDVKTDQVTTNSITISFLQWTQRMVGGLPPTGYHIEVSDSGGTQTVNHIPSLQRLSIKFEGLDAGKSYTVTVYCYIQGFRCPGESPTASVSTYCIAPEVPGTITLSYEKAEHDGRQMWRCSARWEAPNKANCEKIAYRYKLNGSTSSAQQEETTAVFYVDGDEEFTFSVQALNTAGESEFRSKRETSGVLKPQFKGNQPKLTAVNASCVTLSKTEPQYPGGVITQYQFKCDNHSWQAVGNLEYKTICKYKPHTTTECQLRAENTAEWGNSQEQTTTTKCAEPIFTDDPTASDDYDPKKKRRQVTVTVKGIQTQCSPQISSEYKIPGRSFSSSNVIEDLDALTIYNITIRATNHENFSNQTFIQVKTGELEPWSEPVITDKYSETGNCVIIEWEKPLQPNGVIVEYEHRCTKSGEEYHDYLATKENSLRSCGYESGDLVECSVRAATAIGFGPAEEIVVHVTCSSPSTPAFNLSSDGVSKDTATIDIFLIESQHRCELLFPYLITIRDFTGNLFYFANIATSGTISVPNALPFTNYTVTIKATNNEYLSSQSEKSLITAETKTPERPVVILESNTSCVTVNLYKPQVPNGVILSYMVTCIYSGTAATTDELKSDDYGTTQVDFCSIPSATRVECLTSASNSIGTGEVSIHQVYTQLIVVNLDHSKLEEVGGVSKGISFKIRVKRIEVERGAIGSYLVMLTKQPDGRVKREVGSCGCTKESANKTYTDSKDCNCYTTAELPASQVGNKHTFTVGDNKMYGGYSNRELEAEAVYLVYIGVKVPTEEGHDPLIGLHPDYITVTAPKGDRSVGVIAGTVVGGLCLIVLVVLLLCITWRRRNHKSQNRNAHRELTRQTEKEVMDGCTNMQEDSGKRADGRDTTIYESVDPEPEYEMVKRNSEDHVYSVAGGTAAD